MREYGPGGGVGEGRLGGWRGQGVGGEEQGARKLNSAGDIGEAREWGGRNR